MSTKDEEIARWNAERDAVLRSLSIEKFMAFWDKHDLPKPAGGWVSPNVPLIMMHKSRLQILSMTNEEKRVSKEWLLLRGYSLPPGTE